MSTLSEQFEIIYEKYLKEFVQKFDDLEEAIDFDQEQATEQLVEYIQDNTDLDYREARKLIKTTPELREIIDSGVKDKRVNTEPSLLNALYDVYDFDIGVYESTVEYVLRKKNLFKN